MSDNRFRNIIRAAFLIAGIAMIIYGATRGQAAEDLSRIFKVLLRTLGLG